MSKEEQNFNDIAEKQFIVQRSVPESALDFNMQMLDSLWGSGDIPKELRAKLIKTQFFKDLISGEESTQKDDLWALLGFYTRDLRLGCLDVKKDIPYCEYYLNLANDLLKADFIEPFIIALSRVASKVEISQSKNGFLRRRPNTLRTEKVESNLEPKKQGLFQPKSVR